jgi:hypothetical protein
MDQVGKLTASIAFFCLPPSQQPSLSEPQKVRQARNFIGQEKFLALSHPVGAANDGFDAKVCGD